MLYTFAAIALYWVRYALESRPVVQLNARVLRTLAIIAPHAHPLACSFLWFCDSVWLIDSVGLLTGSFADWPDCTLKLTR